MSEAENQFISIDYTLTIDSGAEIDRSKENEPLGFITGTGQIIPGLEKALIGMKAGDTSTVTVKPEDGYGTFNEELIHDIPRDQFPPEEKIEQGMTFQAQGPEGPIMINVVKVNENESVTVDLNHPLAGKELVFDVTIVEVRDPSQEELAQLNAQSGCGCSSNSQDSCGSGCGCDSDEKSQSEGCGCC